VRGHAPYYFQLNLNSSYQNYENLSCSVPVGFSQKERNKRRKKKRIQIQEVSNRDEFESSRHDSFDNSMTRARTIYFTFVCTRDSFLRDTTHLHVENKSISYLFHPHSGHENQLRSDWSRIEHLIYKREKNPTTHP